MPGVKVLSWNIQKFGSSKIDIANGGGAVFQLIGELVREFQPDIVGIMEVMSSSARSILRFILAKLNNIPGQQGSWAGSCSKGQTGSPYETYIFLWKTTTVTTQTQAIPGPLWLTNVIDYESLAGFFATHATDFPGFVQKSALISSLTANGYAETCTYKVDSNSGASVTIGQSRLAYEKWVELNTSRTFDFSKDNYQLPATCTDDLAKSLLHIDVLQFLEENQRSPYIGRFQVLDGNRNLTVVLYHAPFDNTRFNIFNVIAQSDALAADRGNGGVLLMGDFNVDESEINTQADYYVRVDGDGQFGRQRPVNQLHGYTQKAVFADVEGAPLSLAACLNNTPTTLKKVPLPINSPAASVWASSYDRFFFGTADNQANGPLFGNPDAERIDLVTLCCNVTGNLTYDPNWGQAMKALFVAMGGVARINSKMMFNITYSGIQNKIVTRAQNTLNSPSSSMQAKMRAQVTIAMAQKKVTACTQENLLYQNLLDSLNDATVPAPNSWEAAAYAYSQVSDHLPILFTAT
jgi:endonuclease/exonuclease/phosphatase family metal-dependent hydrolase